MLKEWEKLQKQVSNKLDSRNTFAHWQVSSEFWKMHDNDKIMLRPVSHDSRYAIGMKELPIYRLTEILGISDSFLELYNKLNAFARKITALKEPMANLHLLPDVEE